jgi:predicted RNA-binding protein YlxR (DUF448 family)
MGRGARAGRVKQVRERRCVATGEVKPDHELLRVVLGPEDILVPDLAAKLPGRGGWISADRALIDQAVTKNQFNRAFEKQVKAPSDLADQFEALLRARGLSLLGLARRAGRLAIGFNGAKLALSKGAKPGWRIEASDGAEDGRGKLDRLASAVCPGLSVAGCYSAEAMGQALGRGALVHAVLAQGPEAQNFGQVMARLSGFCLIDPFRSEHSGH